MKLEDAMKAGDIARTLTRLDELEGVRTREDDPLTPRPLTITTPGWGEPINIPGSLGRDVSAAIQNVLQVALRAAVKNLKETK